MTRRAVAWVIDAAHVPNGWYLVAPFGILAVGSASITAVDALEHGGHPILAWAVVAAAILALIAEIVVGVRRTDAP